MKRSTAILKILLSSALLTQTAVAAETTKYICTKDSLHRRIEVKYIVEGQKVPCEVVYFKEGDSEGKVKWAYNNEAGQCEKHAKAFSEKLATMGWSCVAE